MTVIINQVSLCSGLENSRRCNLAGFLCGFQRPEQIATAEKGMEMLQYYCDEMIKIRSQVLLVNEIYKQSDWSELSHSERIARDQRILRGKCRSPLMGSLCCYRRFLTGGLSSECSTELMDPSNVAPWFIAKFTLLKLTFSWLFPLNLLYHHHSFDLGPGLFSMGLAFCFLLILKICTKVWYSLYRALWFFS